MTVDPFATARALAAALPGIVGACALGADGTVLHEERADEDFIAASVIKLPLVMTLYADAAEGRLSLDERVPIGERVPGSGVLRLLGDVPALSLRDLAALAVAVSDNTATNLLIDRVSPARVGERLRGWGCERTVLGRKMYDLEARACGIENRMTPRETCHLLLCLVRGECADRATSDAVLAVLRECQDGTRLSRFLPPGTDLAHKSGWVDGVSNDAGVVRAARAVAVAGFTREVTDPLAADTFLGALGRAAYLAAGGAAPPLPFGAPDLT